jgi:tRNA(Arg) A34 adenosine deaminase TadA
MMMQLNNHEYFMRQAIKLARENIQTGEGGPFGAIVVKDGEVIGRGANKVTSENDPTAHAEVMAIRDACRTLNSFQLEGCVIYSSCEPCPMCLGAIYWARPEKLFFAASRQDAARAGFDDSYIYQQVSTDFDQRDISTEHLLQIEAVAVFDEWIVSEKKIPY